MSFISKTNSSKFLVFQISPKISFHSIMTNSKWKTKVEAEKEDNKRYLRQKEATRARRIAKQIAEGFKCTFDNCGMKFETPLELKAHAEKHNQECRDKMICNQPGCGQQV